MGNQILNESAHSIIKGSGIKSLVIIAVALALWSFAFWPAINSALYMWYSDTTFNHCFFVIPAALYFGYKDWHRLDLNNRQVDFLAVVAAIGLVGFWGFGYAANIQLFVHVAAFMILPVLIWFCIGRSNALKLWFPLTFLIFAVPFGSELIAPFQKITAEMAVFLLNAVGIPTFQSGLYIDVPNGKFEVAEACAGVRFFVASICFGYFYAYVSYQKLYKRIAFIAFSAVFPIIANGIRVFGTIVIGEKIGMQYAAGADHLIYGWVFFAIVLLALIWIGSYWQDTPADVTQEKKINNGHLFIPALVLLPLLVIGIWRVVIDKASPAPMQIFDKSGINLGRVDSKLNWQPQFHGAVDTVFGTDKKRSLQVFVAGYNIDSDEAELISFNNRFYHQDVWTIATEQSVTIDNVEAGVSSIHANLLDLRMATGQHRAVVYWYKLPGYSGASVINVKLRQAFGKLVGKQYPAAVIAVSREYNPNIESGYQYLLNDINSLLPELEEITKRLD